MRDMHRTVQNFPIAFLIFLFSGSMLMAARRTRDLPSSANGNCTAIAGCEGSVIFLDKVGQISAHRRRNLCRGRVLQVECPWFAFYRADQCWAIH
jgi:hypothetical protein